MSRFRAISTWVVALVVTATACTDEVDRIDMNRVPPPPGGTVETVTLLETEEASTVVAPSREALFVRSNSGSKWQSRSVDWPGAWRQAAASPLGGVMWSKDSFNFPSSHRFTSHAGRLWMLTRHMPSDRVHLLVSADGGATWGTRKLPTQYRPSGSIPTNRRGTTGSDLARVSVRAPVRLVDRGAQGLYLLDESRVWRADFSEDRRRLEGWTSIDVSDIEVLGSASATTLPTVVRNYLPATDERPFELLTTFGDRLYIYRRHRNSDHWLLVATLPTIDIDLYAPKSSSMVYLLAPDALYRSGEYGEQWEKLTIRHHLGRQPANRAIAFVPRPDTEARAPPFIVVGAASGAIYRSTDGGDSWKIAREADLDNRAITGLVAEPDSGRVWASTAGLGVLSSTDRGTSWSQTNQGLRSTRPLALKIGLNDELLLGTRAGLFRLTGAPEDGHWNRYHARATSAVEIDRKGSQLFSGTIGGTVVAGPNPETSRVSQVETAGDRDAPLFRPWSIPSSVTEPRAIVSLETRPDSQELYAWSRKRGLLRSSDGGVTWQGTPLNSALSSALEQSLVTNFLVDRGGRMYMTSQGFQAGARAQLWRSFDDGGTWHAVHTSPAGSADQPIFLRQEPDHETDRMFFARGSRLARSTDSGDHWRELEGPWTNGTIRSYTIRNERHTIAFNTRHSARVSLATAASDDAERSMNARTYTMSWPESGPGPRNDIRDVLSIDQFVFVITDTSLYAGTVPEGESQLPHAPTIIATLIVVLLMIALSFWYLRFEL